MPRGRAKQTHCKNGHEFISENTYIRPSNGQRCCRKCKRQLSKKYYHLDPEKARLRTYLQRKDNPRSDRLRHRARWRRYGIDPDTAEYLLSIHSKCQACGGDGDSKFNKLIPDHDHQTGYIRGILCGKCNKAIGLMGDNLDGVMKLVQYLQRAYSITPLNQVA